MSFFTVLARYCLELAADPKLAADTEESKKKISDAITHVGFLVERDSPLAVKLLGEHVDHPVEEVRNAVRDALTALSKSQDPAVREFAQAKLNGTDAQNLQKSEGASAPRPKNAQTAGPETPARKIFLIR